MKFYFIDRLGWPVELIKGRYIQNFLRLLIHTRKITTKRPKCMTSKIFENCETCGRSPE